MFAKTDKVFLTLSIILTTLGILIFISASMGILAKNEAKFWGVISNQLILGLGCGTILFIYVLRRNFRIWKDKAFFLLIGAVILTLLVYIPGVGFSHGGANRWVSLGPVSFQPAEFLKIAVIIYMAGWLSWVKGRVNTLHFGLLPFLGIIGLCAGLLIPQPDTKSLILIITSVLAMYFVAGLKWKYVIMIVLIGILGGALLISMRPYLLDRVTTFINPANDPQGSSYQLKQSLIAIGSGGVFGRGPGQSIQKFSYLPEPQGDSVFAVVGEEFGFVGTTVLILLFVAFAMRGLRIASKTVDPFGKYLIVGFITLIIIQSFMNIASIIGLFPLTGVPLVFVSHGGTALALSLGVVALILNISKSSHYVR